MDQGIMKMETQKGRGGKQGWDKDAASLFRGYTITANDRSNRERDNARNQWTEPEDLSRAAKMEVGGYVSLVLLFFLHVLCLTLTITEVGRIIGLIRTVSWGGLPDTEKGNLLYCLATLLVDFMIGLISGTFLLIVYSFGGSAGVANALSWISLIGQGLQAIAYDVLAIVALVMLSTRIEECITSAIKNDSDNTVLYDIWIQVCHGHLGVSRLTSLGVYLIVSVLGIFYLSYSWSTVKGLGGWFKKHLTTTSVGNDLMMLWYSGPQKSAYVYTTGERAYVHSLQCLAERYEWKECEEAQELAPLLKAV